MSIKTLKDHMVDLQDAVQTFYLDQLGAAGLTLPPLGLRDLGWLSAQQLTTSLIKYSAPCYVQLLCFATNVGFTVDQLSDSGWSIIKRARATIEKAESQWYQRYWNLVGPYFTVSDLLSMFNMSSMVEFYTRFGIPSAVEAAANNYAAGQISMAQLRQTMHLNTNEEVMESLGNFGITIVSRRFLTDSGLTYTNAEVVAFLQNSSSFYNSLTDERKESVNYVVNALQDANATTLAQIDEFFLIHLYGDGGAYNVIRSGASDTTILGTNNSDLIIGNNNTNTISGGSGNDIIAGSHGDDILQGEGGNDVYIYSPNEGDDIISDIALIGENNKLVLTSGILQTDVSVSQVNNDLVLLVGDDFGSVTIQNWFTTVIGGTWQMSEIIFDTTGDVWTPSDIEEMLTASNPDSNPSPSNMEALNYQLDRAVMDIAIADMNLNGDYNEQVCESLGYVPAYDSNPVGISASVSGELLLEDERKTA